MLYKILSNYDTIFWSLLYKTYLHISALTKKLSKKRSREEINNDKQQNEMNQPPIKKLKKNKSSSNKSQISVIPSNDAKISDKCHHQNANKNS